MHVARSVNIQNTAVWNEVKNWGREEKVSLITLLSKSLAEIHPSEESSNEKTRRMIEKYAGCWNGNDTPEDTITAIADGRHSSMNPLKL